MATKEQLELFTVYNHPTDFPDNWVVRRYILKDGIPVPDNYPIMVAGTLELIQEEMNRRGLIFVPRFENDDEKIYGVYI